MLHFSWTIFYNVNEVRRLFIMYYTYKNPIRWSAKYQLGSICICIYQGFVFMMLYLLLCIYITERVSGVTYFLYRNILLKRCYTKQFFLATCKRKFGWKGYRRFLWKCFLYVQVVVIILQTSSVTAGDFSCNLKRRCVAELQEKIASCNSAFRSCVTLFTWARVAGKLGWLVLLKSHCGFETCIK